MTSVETTRQRINELESKEDREGLNGWLDSYCQALKYNNKKLAIQLRIMIRKTLSELS